MDTHQTWRWFRWVWLLSSVVFATQASAYSTGITGVSGRQGPICNQPFCHGGGVAPTVSLEGPRELAPGAIATFRFVIQSNSPQQIAAGLNVAASAGTLMSLPGQGTRLMAGEITHTMPKANDSSGQAAFEFQWQAPSQPGSYTLFAAGNSVNRNGTNQGDLAAATTRVVQVVAEATTATSTPSPTSTLAPSPTATVTPEPIPPSPTASPTPSPTATMTPEATLCPGDCNDDREVTVDELVTGVSIALELAPVDRCAAMDSSGDGQVTIDELLRAVNVALSGCPAAP